VGGQSRTSQGHNRKSTGSQSAPPPRHALARPVNGNTINGNTAAASSTQPRRKKPASAKPSLPKDE
jgi:hypothetical protein